MLTIQQLLLALTALIVLYLLWRLYGRWRRLHARFDLYYILGFAALLLTGILRLFTGNDVLESPYGLVLTSLIPIGIAMGIAEEYFPRWKSAFKWVMLVGIMTLFISSLIGAKSLNRAADVLFHGAAGLVILVGPFLAKGAPKGFRWVGVGAAAIGVGGVAFTALALGTQLLVFNAATMEIVLPVLLLPMTLGFTYGLLKDIEATIK